MFYHKTKNIQIIQKRSIYMSEFTIWRRLGLAGSLASKKYFSKPCGLVCGMEQVTSIIQNRSFYSVFFNHVTVSNPIEFLLRISPKNFPVHF